MHYFSPRPDVPSKPGEVQLRLSSNRVVALKTDRGVFSHLGIDPGTQILLNTIPKPPAGDLLDLGCGYGPIAVWLARQSQDSQVWAIDSNERALELTAENASALKLVNIRPELPEKVPAEIRFAAIYSNPPVRIGKQALHTLLMDWLQRLRPDGVAHLVVQRHLGSDSLAAWLLTQGFLVERIRSQQAYRVLRVTKG